MKANQQRTLGLPVCFPAKICVREKDFYAGQFHHVTGIQEFTEIILIKNLRQDGHRAKAHPRVFVNSLPAMCGLAGDSKA
jgi:hypothetical protein